MKRIRDMRRIADVRSPRSFLDFEPTDFCGRAEYLERLYLALAEKPGPFLLHGGPGCGKSMLALKFAWRAQGAFDAVIFQTCGQRPASEIGAELAERLQLDVKALPPERQITAATRWLTERRALLVLDDIWNDDVIELIPGPPASVLCTSRRTWTPRVSPVNTAEVKSFSEDEAESVFRIYLGEEITARHRAALLEFAARMERLPIAVVVAADTLRRRFDPVDEAARALQLEELRNQVHDVPGSLQRAIEAQPEREQRLLQAMAVCGPEGF